MIDIDAAADLLFALRDESRSVTELPESARPATLDEAYAVQDRLAARLGKPTTAWKVGAWGAPLQRRLGLEEPFSGRYQEPFVVHHPAVLGWERFATRPQLECEVGLRLGRDLEARDAPFTPESIREAVDAVVPTIEVVTARIDDPLAVGGPSLVADNGMAGYLVLGEPVAVGGVLDGPGLGDVAAVLRVNGDIVAEGDLASAGYDPFDVVAWLAGHLARRGIGLSAGSVVSTGSLTGVWPARPGDTAVADLGRLGRLSVLISD